MTAAMVLMAAFASCEKDKDSKKDDPSGGGASNVINATNVINGNSSIATVKAMADYDDYVFASGKYGNNGFKLNLPATVSDEYLYYVSGEYGGNNVTISDPEAKMTYTWIEAYDKDGEQIGEFFVVNANQDWGLYVYVDRNVTVKGKDSFTTYDCSFTKGWNIIYFVDNESLTTTKQPSGTIYWYFNQF